jgi:hypothetical protein
MVGWLCSLSRVNIFAAFFQSSRPDYGCQAGNCGKLSRMASSSRVYPFKVYCERYPRQLLGDGARIAKDALDDQLGRVRRAINYELLERCLFLFRWTKSYAIISETTTLTELLNRCTSILGSLAPDDTFLQRFRLSRADLITFGSLLLQSHTQTLTTPIVFMLRCMFLIVSLRSLASFFGAT